MKKKLSATIDEDAYELLARAAEVEGVTVSEMVERSVRLACSSYLPHAIEVTLLDNGGCSIALSQAGVVFHSRRATRRHDAATIRGAVRIETPGQIDADRVAAALRVWSDRLRRVPPRAVPIRGTIGKLAMEVRDLSLRRKGGESSVDELLMRAASAVEAAEVLSASELAQHRCPTCGGFLTKLSVWAVPGDAREREEREWTCGLGHRTSIAGGPHENAADAFAAIGPWEGESPDEIAAILAAARKRGGTRSVPEL